MFFCLGPSSGVGMRPWSSTKSSVKYVSPLLNSSGETRSAKGLSSRASNRITQPPPAILSNGGVFLLEPFGPSPGKFYKGGSQEKTLLPRPEFFLLPSPRERARVRTCRAMGSVCRAQGPSDLGFFYQRFSLPFATKPISSETRKAEWWSGANHGSIGDSWPIAFSGCPRGPSRLLKNRKI